MTAPPLPQQQYPPDIAPHAYETPERVGLKAAGLIAGGAVFLMIVLVQFVLLLVSDRSPRNDIMPGLLGGMSVIWVGMFARAAFLLRSVVRAIVDPAGLHLEGLVGRTSIAWSQIDRLERRKHGTFLGDRSVEVLELYDARGKRLGGIPDTLLYFEDLAARVAQYSAAARGHATYDADADRSARERREARKLRWTAAGAGLLTLGMATGFVAGLWEEWHERRLRTEGVVVPARVERRHMIRVTPYLGYAFADAAGHTHRREVMMHQAAWDELADADEVPVVYLPDKPAWNRPVAGEDRTRFGGVFLLVTGGGLLLFGTCFVLTSLGMDLNSENGVTTLTRRGRVIRSWGKPATPPPVAQAPPWAPGPVPPPPPPNQTAWPEPIGWDAPRVPPPHPVPVPIFEPVPSPQKPKGLIALGVLCVVFGALGVLFGLFKLVLVPRLVAIVEEGGGVVEIPAWTVAWNAADAALAALLAVGGIGLLMLRRWSRPYLMAVGLLQVLSGVAAVVLLVVSMTQLPAETGPDSMTPIAGGVGAILWNALCLVFPIILVAVLSRPSTVRALATADGQARLNA